MLINKFIYFLYYLLYFLISSSRKERVVFMVMAFYVQLFV